MKIDGKQIAQDILDDLKKQTGKLKKKNIIPRLAIILVGTDPSSVTYVNQKKIKAELIGAKTTIKRFPIEITTTTLLEEIKKLNNNKDIHGIIAQQPLPSRINPTDITKAINPEKDVDGFHPNSNFQMPIATAVLKILEKIYTQNSKTQSQFTEWLKSKKIVVIGKGETGGKPIIQMFKKQNIEPIIIDSKTLSPEKITIEADIIISAVGKPNIIKPQMIKRGVILIGIGISRGESAKLMGDYVENEIKDIASFYTPIPGGIGPVNVAMLLKNLVEA